MFNLGFAELMVIAVIGLLVLGPEQLPVVARKVARALNQFKSVMDDAMTPMNDIKKNTQEYIDSARTQMEKVEDDVRDSIESVKEEAEAAGKPQAKPTPLGMNDDKPGISDD